MNTRTLFEVSRIGNTYGVISIILLFVAIVGLYCLILHEKKKAVERGNKETGVLLNVVLAFILVVFLFSGVVFVMEYMNVVIPYQNGVYQEVEGTVYEFSGKHDGDHGHESFMIDNVLFEYGNGLSWGYCQLGANGGVVKGNGQDLIIRYEEYNRKNVIVYIGEYIKE